MWVYALRRVPLFAGPLGVVGWVWCALSYVDRHGVRDDGDAVRWWGVYTFSALAMLFAWLFRDLKDDPPARALPELPLADSAQ